jgi:hypothetical protein
MINVKLFEVICGVKRSISTYHCLVGQMCSAVIEAGQKNSYPRVSLLNFQAFSFIRHLLMEVFPLVFYHPLDSVDPCFEDGYEDFLSDFVENVSDCAFYTLPARDVVFGEFSLDITKRQEVTWCEVRAVSRLRRLLDLFCMKTFR